MTARIMPQTWQITEKCEKFAANSDKIASKCHKMPQNCSKMSQICSVTKLQHHKIAAKCNKLAKNFSNYHQFWLLRLESPDKNSINFHVLCTRVSRGKKQRKTSAAKSLGAIIGLDNTSSFCKAYKNVILCKMSSLLVNRNRGPKISKQGKDVDLFIYA